jgi:hypothetical protein
MSSKSSHAKKPFLDSEAEKLPEYEVVMAVVVKTQGVDYKDAYDRARAALLAFKTPTPHQTGILRSDHVTKAVDALEIGVAARNGYLTLHPTGDWKTASVHTQAKERHGRAKTKS